MTIRVQLFAIAKELAGADYVTVELPTDATVADLRSAVASESPGLADIVGQVAIAVDSEYADDETPLTEQSTVALIPPVSGG